MVPFATTLWPIHPKPLEGEVLSSWLLRTAEGNGLDVISFRRLQLPKTPGTGNDIDLFDDRAFFDAATSSSGVPYDRLVAAGYAGDEGSVFTRRTSNNFDWIIPLSKRGEWTDKCQVSLPFCPSCLATDRVPFYRKVWRYAFHPICPTHGLLTNHCPSCGQDFSYFPQNNAGSHNYGVQALKCCTACGRAFRICSTASSPLVERALMAQNCLHEGLAKGWMLSGSKGAIHIAMYLRGLHEVIGLILNPSVGIKVIEWIASQNSELQYPGHAVLGNGRLESRSSTARAWLLVFAYWLVQEWPTRFVSLAQETNLPVSALLPKRQFLPAWMLDQPFDHLFIETQKRSPEERLSAQQLLARLRGFPPNNESPRVS